MHIKILGLVFLFIAGVLIHEYLNITLVYVIFDVVCAFYIFFLICFCQTEFKLSILDYFLYFLLFVVLILLCPFHFAFTKIDAFLEKRYRAEN